MDDFYNNEPYEPTPEEIEEMESLISEKFDDDIQFEECGENKEGIIEFQTEDDFSLWLLCHGIIW